MVEFTEDQPKTFKIKLKFSKGKNKKEGEEEKIIGDDSLNFDHDDQKEIQSKEKVCKVCNKVFGSGKALGGHMRIHCQAYENLIFKEKKKKNLVAQQSMKFKKLKYSSSSSLDQLDGDEPSCALCGKSFPSMKSLFGHMRCHPEREWRGIHPPPPLPSPPSPAKNSAFSLSTNTEEELINDDDDDDDDDGDDEDDDDDDDDDDDLAEESVNLMEVLPSWSVTAKRRRKAVNVVADDVVADDVVEDEFRDGVDYLMMLANGEGDSSGNHSSDLAQKLPKGESYEVSNSKPFENNNKVVGLVGEDHELVNDQELKVPNDGVISNIGLVESGGKCKNNVLESEDKSKRCENNSLIGKEGFIIKSKKERKKMKLIRDLDQNQDNSPPLIIHDTPPSQVMDSPPVLAAAARPEKYKCSICEKCFPTHQALGGHKSSHKKFRMFIHNAIDDQKMNSSPSATHTGSTAKKVMKKKKEVQENDERVGTQQHHQYLSKVCDKIFHSGQTLGGPKRCHWDNNISPLEVEAQSISIQDKVASHANTGRMLDFDLNELPPAEEDHIL